MRRFFSWVNEGIHDEEIRPILAGVVTGIVVSALVMNGTGKCCCSKKVVGKWNFVK